MSEQIPPQVLPTTEPAGAPIEPISVADKIIGVLSEPSATFENVKQAGPRTSDWVIPLLILSIIAAIGAYLMMTSPKFQDTLRQQFEGQVAAKKMTQEQADQALDYAMRFAPISSTVGALIGVPIVFFLIAFVYWLILKFAFKGTATFSLLIAAYGLTMYIGIIDQLLAILLRFVTGNMMASCSLGMLVEPEMTSTTFKLLSALNPITIWSMVVLGIGFAKVSDLSKEKTWGLVFGLWIVWTLATAFIKIPFMG